MVSLDRRNIFGHGVLGGNPQWAGEPLDHSSCRQSNNATPGGRFAMAQLRPIERTKLEKLLEMHGGYVLAFSNNTLANLVAEVADLELYDQKYAGSGQSKANRMREFWRAEPD